jgi:DNA polymerase III delta subunit
VEADALNAFVERVGPHARLLSVEAEKLAAYVGERDRIAMADVEAVVTRGRHARAFALADALGDRQLGRALRHLDEELWSMQSDRQKTEIGLLYAVIAKVRAMLLAKEMLREGLIRLVRDYPAFAAQLKGLPADRFASDKRYNPTEMNAYVLFRAALQSARFTRDELVAAMEELMRCNRRLVGSGVEGRLSLQFALARILGAAAAAPPGGG